MRADAIAAKVAFGYAKAASKLGLNYTAFRPSGPLTPALASQNRLGVVQFIASVVPNLSFAEPSKYGNPVQYGAVTALSGTALQHGDYLTVAGGQQFLDEGGDAVPVTGTYFVGSRDPLLPMW